MKVRRLLRIWPLRPTPAATGLQLCCWLAAAALALALATAPAAGPSARPHASATPDNPHLLIAQRRCIDRIIGLAKGQTEEAIFEQINRLCMALSFSKPSSGAGIRLLSCQRAAAVRFTPATKRVAGCLGG
jgi:hypothetical protein